MSAFLDPALPIRFFKVVLIILDFFVLFLFQFLDGDILQMNVTIEEAYLSHKEERITFNLIFAKVKCLGCAKAVRWLAVIARDYGRKAANEVRELM